MRRPYRGTQGLLLHHDNASAHTMQLLVANSVNLVTRPPYSPDLAPCDWCLFPFIEKQLRGIQFQNPPHPQPTWSGDVDRLRLTEPHRRTDFR